MGRLAWMTVVDKTNTLVTEDRERDIKGLQSKFTSLHSKKTPLVIPLPSGSWLVG